MDPNQLSAPGKKFFERIEFDEDERLVREVTKDPFGLLMIYVSGAIITLLLFCLFVIGGSFFSTESVTAETGIDNSSFQGVLVAVGFFLTIFAVIITAVVAFLYKNSIVLITSEKVVQQLYISLFNRKISQLSIADVQDVTVKQQGIFAHIFDYGTLTIETAGEQSNYTFTFTPEPYQTAKDLVGSHEADVAKHGN